MSGSGGKDVPWRAPTSATLHPYRRAIPSGLFLFRCPSDYGSGSSTDLLLVISAAVTRFRSSKSFCDSGLCGPVALLTSAKTRMRFAVPSLSAISSAYCPGSLRLSTTSKRKLPRSARRSDFLLHKAQESLWPHRRIANHVKHTNPTINPVKPTSCE